jgi:thiamine-monophosphate kinase
VPSVFDIIRRHFYRPARRALLGVGDDAALLAPAPGAQLAVSTDLLLEGRHFPRGTEPWALGHKALAVNLSDLAAMGATPRWATLALALPAPEDDWLAAFAAGFYALAERFGVELVGGDTTRGPLALCVTILGEVPAGQALLRSGAREGDDVWVSGELGGAALALMQPDDKAAARRLHEPEPRVALGERLRGLATSAIDVSDGFAQDLGHILERSGVGARIDYDNLPKHRIADVALERRCVLAGGDDYELVFTAPPAARARLEGLQADLGLALSRVGAITPHDAGLRVLDESGAPLELARGFDHFAA